jgi:hypothetical protein
MRRISHSPEITLWYKTGKFVEFKQNFCIFSTLFKAILLSFKLTILLTSFSSGIIIHNTPAKLNRVGKPAERRGRKALEPELTQRERQSSRMTHLCAMRLFWPNFSPDLLKGVCLHERNEAYTTATQTAGASSIGSYAGIPYPC